MSQLREAIENEETEPRVKREETNPHNHKDGNYNSIRK